MSNWKTRLIQSTAKLQVPGSFRSLNPPVHRASTVLFEHAADATDEWNQYEVGYTYGLFGTPTTLELAARVCELEGGFRSIVTAAGQGAISLIHLAMLKSGDHMLMPESIYGPNRSFAGRVLRRFGVETGYYPPDIGAGIDKFMRPNTRLVWCESPGSITMEVQDVPAIAAAVHAYRSRNPQSAEPDQGTAENDHRPLVVLDNTWSAGVYFDAFAHGVDITMQALTKYIGGHSDLLLGSVTVREPQLFDRLGATHQVVGCAASPDDCSLALRGMKTLALRLKTVEQSAIELARWLAGRPEIERVLHPALPSCPGHELWKRDFSGSSGLFSIVFQQQYKKEQVQAFVDALKLFKIGYSWGGVASLAMAYDLQSSKRPAYGSRLVRLYTGLEAIEDLKADVEQALGTMSS